MAHDYITTFPTRGQCEAAMALDRAQGSWTLCRLTRHETTQAIKWIHADFKCTRVADGWKMEWLDVHRGN